jgi:hypothetical protein
MNKDQLIAAIESKKAEYLHINKALIRAEDTLKQMENDPACFFDDELSESFDDYLNELYQDTFDALPVTIKNGYAADIIKAEDQPFYREAYNNWLDDGGNYDLSDFDDYQEQSDLVDQLTSDLESIESEIEELESDLEYLENDEIG